MTTCAVDGFADALTAIVEQHVDEIRKQTRTKVMRAGRAAINALRSAHPPNNVTGSYARSWKQKVEGNDLVGYVTEVYNSEGEKTLWLEYGHHLVYFGRKTSVFVAPRPHLDVGYQAGAAELEKQLGR